MIRFDLFVFTLIYLISTFIHHIRRKQESGLRQISPNTRIHGHDDAGLIDTPGNSSCNIAFKNIDQVDKADDAQLEFARLRQKQFENDIIF